METIAVYWEPRIKTYGFKDVLDLSLLTLEFQSERLAAWGQGLYDIGDSEFRFEMVLTQSKGKKALELSLLFARKWEERLIHHINQVVQKDAGEMFHITSPVELVSFFGPHFGERYGIADAVFRALTPAAIPVLAASFTGSIVYLVLPAGLAQKAKDLLTETFAVP